MEKESLTVWETSTTPFPNLAKFFWNFAEREACLTLNDTESLDKPSSRFLSPPDADTAASGDFFQIVVTPVENRSNRNTFRRGDCMRDDVWYRSVETFSFSFFGSGYTLIFTIGIRSNGGDFLGS